MSHSDIEGRMDEQAATEARAKKAEQVADLIIEFEKGTKLPIDELLLIQSQLEQAIRTKSLVWRHKASGDLYDFASIAFNVTSDTITVNYRPRDAYVSPTLYFDREYKDFIAKFEPVRQTHRWEVVPE